MATARLLTVFLVCLLAIRRTQAANGNSFFRKFNWPSWCGGWNSWVCDRLPDGTLKLATQWDRGSSFQSWNQYYHGVFSVRLKFQPGFLGGEVGSFYLISNENYDPHNDFHNEVDFEFLGGNNPRNMTIHLNLFVQGVQYLQQFRFPFDPSAAYHTYTIKWSRTHIVWQIDDTPIRVFNNHKGWFINTPMRMHVSNWGADWVPVKPQWWLGPLVLKARDPTINACPPKSRRCVNSRNTRLPWNKPLTHIEVDKMAKFRKSHLIKIYAPSKYT